jgi:hypothetical protein
VISGKSRFHVRIRGRNLLHQSVCHIYVYIAFWVSVVHHGHD